MHIALFRRSAEIAGDEKPSLRNSARSFRDCAIALKTFGPLTSMTPVPLGPKSRRFPVPRYVTPRPARQTDGSGLALAVIGIGCGHVGFGHSVAFENDMSGLLEQARWVSSRSGAEPEWKAAYVPFLSRDKFSCRKESRNKMLEHPSSWLLRISADIGWNRNFGRRGFWPPLRSKVLTATKSPCV